MAMPTSETIPPVDTEAAYPAALADFARRHALGQGDVVRTYHAVRAMPYRSGPDRTPLTALRDDRGACTARHIVLRDLLRAQGVAAAVELVEGDFAAGFTPTPAMPDALADMVRAGGVRDMHCRVRIGEGAEARRLDATWPDAMRGRGVRVNDGWDGASDTIEAVPGAVVRSDAEDVIGEKERLLAELTPAEATRRGTFLRLLSDWLERETKKGRASDGTGHR